MYGNINHPSHLVHNQFHPDSFEIVRRVYDNLQMIRHLHSKLPELSQINNVLYKIEHLNQYFHDIHNVSESLSSIVNLYNHIPLIKEIAPRVQEFKEYLEDTQIKLNNHNNNLEDKLTQVDSKLKMLDDIYIQYEYGLKELLARIECEISNKAEIILNKIQSILEEIEVKEQYINDIYCEIKEVNEYIPFLVHLKAKDLVDKALYTGLLEDKYKAIEAINYSVAKGNDEDYLHRRLDSINYVRGNK